MPYLTRLCVCNTSHIVVTRLVCPDVQSLESCLILPRNAHSPTKPHNVLTDIQHGCIHRLYTNSDAELWAYYLSCCIIALCFHTCRCCCKLKARRQGVPATVCGSVLVLCSGSLSAVVQEQTSSLLHCVTEQEREGGKASCSRQVNTADAIN